MLQTCPYSGEKFLPRRRNQVFATVKNRMAFHNENAAALRHIKSPIDKQLDRNFVVLSELLEKGERKTFLKDKLLLKGFNPNYFTHLDDYEGKTARCIYHFVLPFSDNPNLITVINPEND